MARLAEATPTGTSAPTVLVSENGSVTTYLPAYFEPFAPFTLRDMVDRIPGVSFSGSSSTEERRGLRGNEDAILVNGQQITGKDSGGTSLLQRLRASQVKHIEVLRGASSELQSTTQRIINIVLIEDAGSSFTVSTAFLNYAGDGTKRINPQVTYNFNGPRQNRTFGAGSSRIYRPWQRSKLTSDEFGRGITSSEEFERRGTHTASATGRVDHTFESGARLQLNGLVEAFLIDREREETVRAAAESAATPPLTDVLETDKRDRYTAELSSDFSFPVGDRKRITLLGVLNWEKETRDRFLRDNLLPGGPTTLSQDRTDIRKEAIGRSVFDLTLDTESSVQFGLEGTFNSQKTTFDLRQFEEGELVQVPIFNSDGIVREYRAEAFTSVTRTFGDGLTVETGLAVEASRITQTGADVDSARQLVFFKPSLTAFWDFTDSAKLILSAARDVDQLDFAEFVSSISERDEELEAGNPDLQPERSWDFELGTEYRLNRGAGVMSLKGFYRRVQDVSGRQVFRSLISQPSNIGDGTEYGFEAEVSLQLSELGLWSGAFSATYLRRHTSVDDPLTGLSRSFDGAPAWELDLEYRHDIDFLIKGELEVGLSQDAPSIIHDVNYTESTDDGPQLRISFSSQLTNNLKFNISVTDALNSERVLDRRLFALGPDFQPSFSGQRIERHRWGRLFTIFFQAAF